MQWCFEIEMNYTDYDWLMNYYPYSEDMLVEIVSNFMMIVHVKKDLQ